MKTLYKTYQYEYQARKRQRKLEAQTGLKWDFYSTGDGYRFTPIITRETPKNKRAAQALMPHLDKRGSGFVELSEVGGLSLADTLAGAKAIVQAQLAIPTVNRVGNWAGIRRRA